MEYTLLTTEATLPYVYMQYKYWTWRSQTKSPVTIQPHLPDGCTNAVIVRTYIQNLQTQLSRAIIRPASVFAMQQDAPTFC